MNILIVDDHPTNRKLLRVSLEAAGEVVWEAGDGLEALACLNREPVQAVICDILMPRMDGFRLCHEIRKSTQFGHLPVLVYTSTYTSPSDEQLALQSGADKYLRKPCAVENILAALRAAASCAADRSPRGRCALPDAQVVQEYNQALVRKLEQKHLELEEVAARLQAIISSAMDAVLCLDADHRVVLFNAAAEKMFGVPAAEVLGGPIDRLMPERFRDTHPLEVLAFARTGVTTRAMGRWNPVSGRRANGEEFPIEASISQIEVRGKKLFTAILRDVTERHQVESDIRQSRAQLRALLARLQRLREEERTRIARQVHDVLGQLLSGLKMDLDWCQRRGREVPEPALRQGLLERLEAASGLADTVIETVQKISQELRPSVLDNLGLGAALQFETRQFQQRTGILCEVCVPEKALAMDPERATGIFRVFQELLTNVARHAQATRVSVALRLLRDKVSLEVRDNGRGIRPDELADPKSLGLMGMAERAALMDGTIEVRPQTGRGASGTTATLIIPLRACGKPWTKR